ncbi:DNA/RNA non-specific endonuclease [Streptomyces sp. NPDC127172]|uniref:DNA/RNA non-specific endonuclease n=1 Tax=Streptomyces sp. NPDC127172 TaxID=3345382 RepID=UPI00362816EF
MLNLINNGQYSPDPVQAFQTAPGGDQNTGPRNRNSADCRRNKQGWVEYACHLLSRELSGSGRDGANLSTCTRPANAMVRGTDRIEKNFRYYEKQVRNAVKQGQVVQYSVEPNYTGGRVVASSWTFNARAWDGNGNPHVLFSGGTVRNELGGKNLGEQFTKKGTPVPLPGS